MTKQPFVLPLRVDHAAQRAARTDTLIRSIICLLYNQLSSSSISHLGAAKEFYPDHPEVADFIAKGFARRGAVDPATGTGWGAELVQTSLPAFLTTLGLTSA